MKRMICALLAAMLLLGLAGCGNYVSIFPDSAAQAEEEPGVTEDGGFNAAPLYTFLGWYDFAEEYYSDTPAAVSLSVVTGGVEGCRSPRMDRTSIITACDALNEMQVTGISDQPAAGQEQRVYTFTMDDGTEYSVVFENGCLVTDSGTYTVSGGDALWTLTFPAYDSGFDVFDLYFSDDVRAFADNFYSDMPVSVGLRSGGGATMTSEDTAVIEQVFSLLSGAVITVVEEHPDQNIDLTQTRDFIFTMADGTYYTFSFAGQCLAVEANDDYGTVYYWLSGHEGLWSVSISPDGSAVSFEGGALYELRDDFASVRQIVNGESEDLTLSGVYITYTIGDETGGVALSAEDAASFLQTVLDMDVSAEQPVETGGDSIEIFVTLSDGSGPSISFSGGSVQQVVGTLYVCDSAEYEAMCDAILAYAATNGNTAEAEVGLD